MTGMDEKHLRMAATLVALMVLAAQTATVIVDQSKRYQQIDGFGAMGGMNPYWSKSKPLYNDEWLNRIIDTIGMTMIRTEFYPMPEQKELIDRQIPWFKALTEKARSSNVPIKYIAAVWTPAEAYKDEPRSLDMSKVDGFAKYLVDYCTYFKTQTGTELFSLCPQNEPIVAHGGYNQCKYSTTEYGIMAKAFGEKLAASGLSTKMHFADNVKGLGVSYTKEVAVEVAKSTAAQSVVWAYSTHYGSPEHLKTYVNYGNLAKQYGTTACNSEFGNGPNTWDHAWQNAQTKLLMLRNGFSAIIYWLMGPHSNSAQLDESLMPDYKMGPKAYVAQAFFRYIRPGAYRVESTCSDPNVQSVAFVHDTNRTVAIILMANSGSATVTVSGTGLPEEWDMYRTGSGNKCVKVGTVKPGQSIQLPAKTVVTLYNPSPGPISELSGPRRQRPGWLPRESVESTAWYTIDGRRELPGENRYMSAIGLRVKRRSDGSTAISRRLR